MDKKNKDGIERVGRMKIHGNVPTNAIRHAYWEGGEEAALKMGNQVLIDATDEQILAIARVEASIHGVTPNTKYVELDQHGVEYNDTCGCEACEAYCNRIDG